MKKTEAMEFVKAQIAEGKTKEEITAALMSQDKIGTSNPTAELVDALYEEATVTPPVPEETTPPTPEPAEKACAPTKGGGIYTKCRVMIDRDGNELETREIKNVKISDEQADFLNRAATTGHGYKIKFIKSNRYAEKR